MQILHRLRRAAQFVTQVTAKLYRNHGLAFASAIAFDLLLSIVPLLTLTVVIVSHVLGAEELSRLIGVQLDTMLPGSLEPVIDAYSAFVEKRGGVGLFGVATLAVFGGLAFRTIRESIDVVFGASSKRRGPLASFLIPLAYVPAFALGVLVATALLTVVDALPEGVSVWLGYAQSPTLTFALMRLGGFAGLVVLFGSFYRFLPASAPPWSLAGLGGVIAASLWELVRSALTWYFTHLSLVGALYGSMASVIVILISFEIAALVMLFSAQIVAEIMVRRSDEGAAA